ncbi:MAG TPA: alpha/beta hydrolase [Acidobacteriota bacterium]|nr:alpha/beta hydrolase [Acidobacteriota bacterium]
MKLFLDGPVGKLEAIFETAGTSAGLKALVCHPHPVHGGTMHNRVVVRIARALLAVGVDVLRINFRGTGDSEGSYDAGVGELQDALAAIHFLEQQRPGWPLIVGGFSFGSWVSFRAGLQVPQTCGLLAAGLPVRHYDFDFVSRSPLPKWVIQGEFDEFGNSRQVAAVVDTFANPKGFSFVPEADHYFSDHIDVFSARLTEAATWLRTQVLPEVTR